MQHLKFTDKKDIIQKEYENVKEKKEKERPFNLQNTNKMLEKKEQKVTNIRNTGRFSAVLKPILRTKYAFCSILRYLEDVRTFALLQTQNFISKNYSRSAEY